MNDLTINANLAIVIRGELMAIKEVADVIERILSVNPEVRVIHKQVSVSKLWIKEGDGMNDRSTPS